MNQVSKEGLGDCIPDVDQSLLKLAAILLWVSQLPQSSFISSHRGLIWRIVWDCPRAVLARVTNAQDIHLTSEEEYVDVWENVMLTPVAQKHLFPEGGLMVWGGITATRLVFIDGNLNAVPCRDDIIQRQVVPFVQRHPNITLQQDNARPHVDRFATAYLNQHSIPTLSSLASQLAGFVSHWTSTCGMRWKTIGAAD